MPVVGVLIDERVGARVGINRVWPDEMRAGELMPELSVDGVDEEQFAVLVPVMAPRIGAASAQRLDDLALRMIAPHRAPQRNALFRRSAERADFARGGGAAAAVKPTIGTEPQTVGEVVIVL